MTIQSKPDANHTNALGNRITRALAVGAVAATLVTGIGASSASANGTPREALRPNEVAVAGLSTQLSDTGFQTFTGNTSAIGPSGDSLAAESNSRRRSDRSDSDLSREESEYIAELTDGFETLNDSLDRFYELLNDPNLGDDESIAELSEILDTWLNVAMDAMLMTPPDGYEEIHEAYNQFTTYLADAAMYLYDGDIVSAATALEDAQAQAEELMDLVEDLMGPDVLDQRSG